jgi:hypothetical protein
MPTELYETRNYTKFDINRSIRCVVGEVPGRLRSPSISPLSIYIRINSFSKGSTTVVVQEDGETTNALKLSFSALSQAG